MSFIFRWKPSVMPLLRVKRHMRTISSVHSDKVWPSVQAGARPLALSVAISSSSLRDVLTARGLALGFRHSSRQSFSLSS